VDPDREHVRWMATELMCGFSLCLLGTSLGVTGTGEVVLNLDVLKSVAGARGT